jgi:hypothetical protein
MKLGDLIKWKKEYENIYSKNVGIIISFMSYDYTLMGCPYEEPQRVDNHDLKVLCNGKTLYWTSWKCEVISEGR